MARTVGERSAGWLLVAASIGLALAAQVAGPVGVPLYDGNPVVEPYRFLHPTGGQAGEPTTFASERKVTRDLSPVFVAATTEIPPQAQLISQEGGFVLEPGTTSLKVSIAPVEAPAAPPGEAIAGNAYAITVTNQDGTPLLVGSCTECLTLSLRAPEGSEGVTIRRFSGGTWQEIETVHAGLVDAYQANVTALGTFAMIGEPGAASDIDPTLLVGGGVVALLLIGGVLLFFKVAPAGGADATGRRQGPGRAPACRIPSKRKGSRRQPPPGRSDR